MSRSKLASNISRAWRPLATRAYYRGAVEPVALLLSPNAAEVLGDDYVPVPSDKISVVDTWAWGWSIRMADGSFRP